MARRAAIGAVVLKEQWQTFVDHTSFSTFLTRRHKIHAPILSTTCGCRIIPIVRHFCSGKPIDQQLNRPSNENLSSMSSAVTKNIQETPREVDLQTIPDGLQTDGRAGRTKNMVFGDTVIDGSTGEWLTLNQKVNTYPSLRRFTAIGIGGNDFVKSMIVAVESVIQHSVPLDDVKQRVSSGGKYVSVNIGPVRVISREQVQAVYKAMRSDSRMKFFL